MTRLVDRAAAVLESRLSRRSFVSRAAMVGSAVAVGSGVDLVLRPGTAYARVCGCAGQDCACGSQCCLGYTEFCCSVSGSNFCPPNTVMGGWWKADHSSYCGGGARYYMDCNATCACETGGAFCGPDCDTTACGCGHGSCDHWKVGCIQFRYGQCNQDVVTMGRIVCRVVACVPPWEIDPTCTRASATDNNTAEHAAPCWEDPRCRTADVTACNVVGIAPAVGGAGYYLATGFGRVLAYGTAVHAGDLFGRRPAQPVAAIAASPVAGYYLVDGAGGVHAFGGAPHFGDVGGTRLNHPIMGVALTPSGAGYWLVARDGGVFCFGDAPFHGSTGGIRLRGEIVGMASTPSGEGYWLAGRDGGVFSFGDARFLGSVSGKTTTSVMGIAVPARTSTPGYFLVGRDGGIFTFGSAAFVGSGGGTRRPGEVVGMAVDVDGGGYWLVANDGEVLAFDAVDAGSPVKEVTS